MWNWFILTTLGVASTAAPAKFMRDVAKRALTETDYGFHPDGCFARTSGALMCYSTRCQRFCATLYPNRNDIQDQCWCWIKRFQVFHELVAGAFCACQLGNSLFRAQIAVFGDFLTPGISNEERRTAICARPACVLFCQENGYGGGYCTYIMDHGLPQNFFPQMHSFGMAACICRPPDPTTTAASVAVPAPAQPPVYEPPDVPGPPDDEDPNVPGPSSRSRPFLGSPLPPAWGYMSGIFLDFIPSAIETCVNVAILGWILVRPKFINSGRRRRDLVTPNPRRNIKKRIVKFW